jgi:hypothetical protein
MNEKIRLHCAWCKKPLKTEDFAVLLIIPTPSEEIKNEILEGLLEAPKQLKIKEKSIEVLYQFCSKDHKNQYKEFLASKGLKVH